MTPAETAPIADAPRDGRTLIVGDETGNRAVAWWADDMWALGHKGEGPIEQVHFEPTLFERRTEDGNAFRVPMTTFRAERLQAAYRERRRQWAAEIGVPYPEDGGVAAGRGK